MRPILRYLVAIGFLIDQTHAFHLSGVRAVSRPSIATVMVEKQPVVTNNPVGRPFRSLLLALITVQSALGLYNEVPALFGPSADYFGTLIDGGFLFYGATTLATQAGLTQQSEPSEGPTLEDMVCTVTLSIGREPGTWMPDEWGASGARLSLPTTVRFTDEPVDLGFPGEEDMNGRFAKRVACVTEARFVSASGEVVVKCDGGAWTATPTGRPGESSVRFYLNFPEGASRNDVSLPAGRVYFSTICYGGEITLDVNPGDFVPGPRGVQLLTQGGMTIKRNDARNLFGALGDVNLILGRFSVSNKGQDLRAAAGDGASDAPGAGAE